MIAASAVLLVVISVPLMWALWVDVSHPNQTFAGLLSNPLDGATYLSKIQVGKEGVWRTVFRHSPGETDGAYVTLIYNGLGQLSRYLGFSNLFVYHVARLVTAFLMCLALYQFASVVWRRQQARRSFFILSLVGSGFGWLVVLFGRESADLVIPEAFPLYSAATNVHFPLALALLALAAGIVVTVFRPGFTEDPTLQNGGATLMLCSLGLAIIAPHALVPFTLALGLLIAIDWAQNRRVAMYQFRWLMLIVLPALPIAGYYIAEVYYNPTVQRWMVQNVTLSPNPVLLLAGLGLPLVIAVPGIVRAVRRFEPDGDQFMLLWLVSILVLLYVPTEAQRRFSMGMMIPVVYFAVRAMTDYWLDGRPMRYRARFTVAVYGFSAITYVLLMLTWFHGAGSVTSPLFYLGRDYTRAFSWLDDHAQKGSVVLASDAVGLWLPSKAGVSVVYGHPFESFDAEESKANLTAWLQETSGEAPVCGEVLTTYNVQYVLVGAQERIVGAEDAADVDSYVPACTQNLTEVEQFGSVKIFAP